MPRDTEWCRGLGDALVAEIREAALSARGESASAIYRRFGLEQRGVKRDTFLRQVKRWRDAQPQAGEIAVAENDLLGGVQAMLLAEIRAGNPKHFPAIAAVLRALIDGQRFEVIDKRAAELSQEKMRMQIDAMKTLLRKGVEERAKDGKVDVGEMYDAIDEVMRAA